MGFPAFRVDPWTMWKVVMKRQWEKGCNSSFEDGARGMAAKTIEPGLKFSVAPTQNFTLEYIIVSGYFADFFSGCCVPSRCSRLEVFNKVMRASWTLNFLWSLKYLAFRKWRQAVHHWWTGAHDVCVVCQQRKLRPVRVSQSTSSEISSYINYINLSNFSSLDYTYWETLFIIRVSHKVMAHANLKLSHV